MYRGKKRPTDVLSFPTDEEQRRTHNRKAKRESKGGFSSASAVSAAPGAPYLGDIAIAPQVALRNSQRFGRTLDDELRILILHGILHLMGFDHETDRGQMDRRELRLRRALGLK
jgi:probable rRNA maturation factor